VEGFLFEQRVTGTCRKVFVWGRGGIGFVGHALRWDLQWTGGIWICSDVESRDTQDL
jgi:hypothetical protein